MLTGNVDPDHRGQRRSWPRRLLDMHGTLPLITGAVT